MKKLVIIFVVILPLFILSCSDIENLLGGDEDPNELNGKTDIALAEEGNTFGVSPKIGNNYVDINEDIKISKNENGIVTLDIKCDVPNIPELEPYISKIPKEMISNGRINAQVKFKVTSDGIQDYFNLDGKPHTIVKYNASVGDKYKLSKSDGKTITREVVARSDKDDFPYGFFDIKTITIEQDSRIEGIKKFVYRANHKFGIVFVEVHMEDGTKLSSYVYPNNY